MSTNTWLEKLAQECKKELLSLPVFAQPAWFRHTHMENRETKPTND